MLKGHLATLVISSLIFTFVVACFFIEHLREVHD